MKFVIAAASVGCAFSAQLVCAGTVEKRAATDPRGKVEIVNVAGEVRVIGWDKPEVHVTADLGGGVERLDFESKGGRTVIEVVLRRRAHAGSSDLTVHAPRDSSLFVNTVSAEQEISDMRGALQLQAVSGSIETDSWGDIEVKTVSGEIEVRGHGGEGGVRVTSVSGDIVLRNIGPDLELETVTGDMDVGMDALTRGRIKTTNGDLTLVTRLSGDARLEAEAINGDLQFLLEAPVNAEFEIETFNGDIDNCFGPAPRRTREFAPGNELRFTQGKGGARVRIQTLNGGVEVCKNQPAGKSRVD